MTRLQVIAPAKVNLFLGVGRVRPDGYHEVRTVLHALALADTVWLDAADTVELECDVDLGIPAERNLAYRAAEGFLEALGVSDGVRITIEKRIPAGAGLGGGSSDAAAVLAGLAERDGISADDARLERLARSLGADVPFFLTGGAASMSGRGDTLARKLRSIEAPVLLVKPAGSVPTAEAYAAFDRDPVSGGDLRGMTDSLSFHDVSGVAMNLANNMTDAAVSIVPQIGEVLEWVGAQDGVSGALMAGSGSAVFALVESGASAETLAEAARERGWWSCATATRSRGVEVVGAATPDAFSPAMAMRIARKRAGRSG
jgi:4-diphosphocytidyl-2-C-methyl-D-erythritol kinase